MPSLSDELTTKAINDGTKAVGNSLKAVKKTAEATVKTGQTAIKGLCLMILNGGGFTTESVMEAVKKVAFKKTGDIKYSKNNIDISKLQKSGHVYKVDENITAEVMKHFDQECKKCNVKYSAMKDDRNPDAPAYMVFFEGKDSDMILHVIKESYKDYLNAENEKKQPDMSKRKIRNVSEKKESVKAKLAFFRDRVAARDKERNAVEKHHSHSDIQR